VTTAPDYFLGMRIYVDGSLDNVPRMQLTPAFAANMPPGWVEETNKWMREFFGTENKIIAIENGRSVVMVPRTFARLKQERA